MHYFKYKKLHILWGTKSEAVVPIQWNKTTTTSIRMHPPFSNYPAMHWNSISMLKQTHSNIIHCIDTEPLEQATSAHEGDGLMCSSSYKAAAIFTADCLPLVVYDKKQTCYTLIHAGWKGTLKGIVKKAVATLQTTYGTNINDLIFFAGPSAGVCCYEVSDDFVYQYNQNHFYSSCFENRQNKWYFNNLLHNQLQLQQEGIAKEQFKLDFFTCTLCSQDYCSYRKDNQLPLRNITIVSLK